MANYVHDWYMLEDNSATHPHRSSLVNETSYMLHSTIPFMLMKFNNYTSNVE